MVTRDLWNGKGEVFVSMKKRFVCILMVLAVLLSSVVAVTASSRDDIEDNIGTGKIDLASYYDKALHEAYDGGPMTSPLPLTLTHLSKSIRLDTGLMVSKFYQFRYYVKTSKNGSWTRLTETSNTSYVYNTSVGGKTYYFTVRAVSNDGRFLSDYKTHSIYYCNVPGSLKAEQLSRGIKVTWDKCVGVSKYRLYRKLSNGWTKLVDTPNNYYVDTNPLLDQNTTYTVRGLDGRGNWCTYFKTAGVSCFTGGPQTTSKLVDRLVVSAKAQSPASDVMPQMYWGYSAIPAGADWCTGFANYVIGKSCGSWRFGGEWHSSFEIDRSCEEELGNIYSTYNNPADWHPYTSTWSRWAYNDDIFYQPWELNPKKGDVVFFRKEGDADTFANVGHVGIVVSSNGDTLTTIEGNADGKSQMDSRVRLYTYKKCTVNGRQTWRSYSVTPRPSGYSSKTRLVSGFIRMSDIYNRKVYK